MNVVNTQRMQEVSPLASYRIYEVAEEMDADAERVVEILRDMGVSARNPASTIDDAQKARLHARWERERRSEDSGGGTATRRRKKGGRRRRRKQEEKKEEEAAVEEAVAEEPEEPVVEEAEEEAAAEAGEEEEEAAGEEAVEAPAAEAEEEAAAEAEEQEEAPEVDITGAAEELAEEHGVDVTALEGTGKDGRILKSDVQAAVDRMQEEAEAAAEEEEEAAAEAGEEEEEEEKKKKKKRKPKPVKPEMSYRPAASAAPGGSVEIDEGYSERKRRKKKGRKKKPRVEKDEVQENVKKTLASMEGGGGGGSGRSRKREAAPSEKELEKAREEAEKRITVNEFLTVSELADMLDESPQEIITAAFKNLGMMVTINQRLDFDEIDLICEEFGYEAVREEAYEADLPELEEEEDEEEDLEPRPPVVTVMGHVDHGKTSLLDHIRKANVIAGESGGITQHVGAYHVQVGDGRELTFIDTPGHEAFTAMRARGADVTDVVILVVAADDGVMPQTEEAISHARNAGVPIIVAINKMDLPTADADAVKQDLLSQELVVEEFGGDVLSQPVSAKTGDGVDDLLEQVLLQAELLELRANPDKQARGTVVEAELDKGMGPLATVLVQEGTLHVGDDFLCGQHPGRVRALLDERGNNVEEAGPGIPVRVLGAEGVAHSGDSFVVLDADRVQEVADRRQELERQKDIQRRSGGSSLEDIFAEVQKEGQAQLNLIIKGDTDGSVQAVADSLEELSTDEVAVDVVHRGVGAINESDVLLATTSDASILGFHVRPDAKARDVAEDEGVEIRTYDVIYEAVQEVRKALEGLLAPEEREVVLGAAEVRELFSVPGAGTVAGSYVQDGTIDRNARVRIIRDQAVVHDGRIGNLKRFKEDVGEVREGYECGISIENFNDVKVGDTIECYEIEEVARTLESAAS